jgi:uncharacterized damage-inducible protein DinB
MKRQLHTILAIAAFTLGTGFTASAQMGPGTTPKIAPGTLIEPSKTFDVMLTNLEDELMGAAKAMPANKYSFAPSAAIFAPSQATDFKGVRTFAAQLTHIAQANYYYAGMAGGVKMDTDVKAIGNLTDKDQIVAALQASFAFAHKAMANLTAKNAFESVRENDTRASLASFLVAHGFDHYGQLVEYLRMNAVIPPASAK